MKENQVCAAKQVVYQTAAQLLRGATWVILMFVVANFTYKIRDDQKKEYPAKKKVVRIREIPLAKPKPEAEKPAFVKIPEETVGKESTENR